MPRRSGGVGVAALVAGWLAISGCSPDAGGPGAADRSEGGSHAPGASAPSGPLSLLYMDGRSIRLHQMRSGHDRVLLRLPSPDAYAAPRGDWVAIVRDARPPAPGQEDFAARPRLALVDPATGRRIDLGPGLSPLWDPSGEAIAWLQPVGERSCSAESCRGEVRVLVGDVPTMRRRVFAPAGRWALLAWAGDRLLLAEVTSPEDTLIASSQSRSRLDVPPTEVWGTSPEGDWLLRSTPVALELVELTAAGDLRRSRRLRGGPATLAEGSWSPGGDTLAAVEVDTTDSGIPRSRVVLISVDSGRIQPLPGSRGATGPVLWSPGGDAVAFARSARGGQRLEAVLCGLSGGRGCRTLFSWRQGVILLRLQHGGS